MKEDQALTGASLLEWRRQQLLRGGRAVDLDWLLDLSGGISWSSLQQLRIDPDRTVQPNCSLRILEEQWNQHLAKTIPLQHIVGRCPWRDVELEVSPAALIPRQETELLLDLAVQRIGGTPIRRWADLGTGSGALAVVLSSEWPEADGHAVDLSSAALSLAKRNLQRCVPLHHCRLHCGSWWEPLKDWWGQFDLVLTNPPYIPSGLVAGLHPVVRDHEPHLALAGGEDGLDAIRRLLAHAGSALSPGGQLLLEHHHDQSAAVLELMEQAGLVEREAVPDLQGVLRFAIAGRPGAGST